MKKFDIPVIYRSPLIHAIKEKRRQSDKLKKDFSPSRLDFGPVEFFLSRHFGFCYGVENAIEIAFKTVEENPDKNIYLLSEMIHNPHVNKDLRDRGVRFLMDTRGKELLSFDVLRPGDIVVTPAFGTTLEMEKKLLAAGVDIEQYNTTCPFVEKVWNKAESISKKDYTVIIHGKPEHEETKATFSHSAKHAPVVVIQNLKEAMALASYIDGDKKTGKFYEEFAGRYSEGFNVKKDLEKIGVVNQTTMLATETQYIADFFKHVMVKKYNLRPETIAAHFADTRDTLCYATHENQGAVFELIRQDADFAIVVGGYNSSNTSHLVELCEQKLPTYFINSEEEIISAKHIHHYNYHDKSMRDTFLFLPQKDKVKILVTSGASCPDALVEGVIEKIVSFFPDARSEEDVLKSFLAQAASDASNAVAG